MKKTRRFAAMVAALALATCSVAPAMMMNVNAAEVYVDATKDNTTTAHTYTAYPIFTGTVDSENNFTVTAWAIGYNSSGLLNDDDFKAMKLNDNKSVVDILAEIDADPNKDGVTASDVARMFEEIKNNDEGKMDRLAELLYQYKGSAEGVPLSKDAKNTTTLNPGYYVINDDYTASTTNDAYSKFMLKVSDNSTEVKIEPKKSYPSVIKKVQENAKTTTDFTGDKTALQAAVDSSAKWNDVADYNIGDAVPFQLYGSMPSTLADYDHYYYLFTDTLGTQFNQPETVTVTVGSKTLTFTLTSSASEEGKVYTLPDADQLKWNYDTTNATKIANVPTTDGNCRVTWKNNKLYVSFEDIKAYDGVDKDTVVKVQYNAVLNNNANIGLPGQTNAVDLTYTNNPTFEYVPDTDTPNTPDLPEIPENPDTPDIPENPDIPSTPPEEPEKPTTPGSPDVPTDKTPEDKVIVFTYEIDLTKKDTSGQTLQGAEFTLQNSAGKFAKIDSNGKFIGWVEAAEATTLVSGATGLFKIIGLDSGTYTLTETKQPDGYPESIKGTTTTLELTATTVNNQAWDDFVPGDALTQLELNSKVQDTAKHGAAEATITNSKTTVLPSTGGIGTTLFYLAGGVMAVGAGIVLVTKKRIGKED